MITLRKPRFGSSQGSTLTMALFISGLSVSVLVAYLSLVTSQNARVMRSQVWNAAIPVIEAGVEEALAHINAHGSTNLACDGWTQTGTTYYVKRWVGSSYYVVTIDNWSPGSSNNAPCIDSRAFVPLPPTLAWCPAPFFAATVAEASSGYLCRGVRVRTQCDFVFAKGLVAKESIDLNGNNIDTDSFDSTNPTYNTNGRYDETKNKDHGDVATNSSLTNSLDIGNANIRGYVSTGPNGSCSIGPNGSVGTKAWVDGNNHGIQPGHFCDDMNVDFKDVTPPFNGGAFTPSSGTVDSTSYDYVLTSGNYQLSSLSMSGQAKLAVTGNAVLYVTGSFSMSGNAYIKIKPGACLKLYVSGASASIGGNGVVNETGYATNFFYYGLPSNTSVSFSGNGEFIGILYAPNAAFTMNGGGSGDLDFVGAAVGRTINMNGHYKFHYDEALGKIGPMRGFIVNSWDELTPTEINSGPAIDYSPTGVLN